MVRLDVGADAVTAAIDLPLDQLSVAFDEELTPDSVTAEATLEELRGYVEDHFSATDDTGQEWSTSVTGGVVQDVDGTDNLVFDAVLTPASGVVGDFELHYDAVIDKLVAHRVFISARYGSTGAYTTLAMLSWQTTSVPVAAASTDTPEASPEQGFLAAIHLGIEHIAEGSDHLLFLLMLLLPAPMIASGRRWVRRDDPGRAGWRVAHVVTAFAIGHSLTLALGAFGLVHLPTDLVESAIALSVLFSAVHALRPLVQRGEVLIAGSFGLLHGLAFATLLGDLDLDRTGLVTTLLGFNLGIELTQLAVVALVIPSLVAISRTGTYKVVRIALALTGATLAITWLGERTHLISTNPLEPVANLLIDQPLALPGALALAAVLATRADRPRRAGERVVAHGGGRRESERLASVSTGGPQSTAAR